MSRLSEVEKESTELDDSVIQDFVHLKNDVAAMRVSLLSKKKRKKRSEIFSFDFSLVFSMATVLLLFSNNFQMVSAGRFCNYFTYSEMCHYSNNRLKTKVKLEI